MGKQSVLIGGGGGGGGNGGGHVCGVVAAEVMVAVEAMI